MKVIKYIESDYDRIVLIPEDEEEYELLDRVFRRDVSIHQTYDAGENGNDFGIVFHQSRRE